MTPRADIDDEKKRLEIITRMFSYKAKFPQYLFFILRGNHECTWIMLIYDANQWKRPCDVFKTILLCGLTDEKITCVHDQLPQRAWHADGWRGFSPVAYGQYIEIIEQFFVNALGTQMAGEASSL